MEVELLIADPTGKMAYQPAVQEGIEWSTERRGTPGKLSFKIIQDDILVLSEGSPVRLRVEVRIKLSL